MALGTARTVLSASALQSAASAAIGCPPTLSSTTRSIHRAVARQVLPPTRACPCFSSACSSSLPVRRSFSTVPTRMTPNPRQRTCVRSATATAAAGAAPTSSSTYHNRRRSYFTYSVAASYIGKDRRYDPATHVFHFNPYHRIQQQTQGKPTLRPESGQDAFFVSRVGDTGAVALGVADGVGGWMDSGVDPADFSHGLCENMAVAAYNHGRQSSSAKKKKKEPLPSPRLLMQLGYDAVRDDPAVQAGGSTAVVGLLTPEGTLECANLGDSGFVQLRTNAVHACSDPQTHAFNTPFQLSVIPPNILARMAAFGGAQLSDEPRDAEVTRHRLQHGDVLVFASDGVWDNLFNQDILHLVSTAMAATGAWRKTEHDAGVQVADEAALKQLTDPAGAATGEAAAVRSSTTGDAADFVTLQSLIATQIAAAAKMASVNTKQDGPFAKEVKRYYPNEVWHGGKVDDICVVVAVVSEETAPGGESQEAPPIKSRL